MFMIIINIITVRLKICFSIAIMCLCADERAAVGQIARRLATGTDIYDVYTGQTVGVLRRQLTNCVSSQAVTFESLLREVSRSRTCFKRNYLIT